MRSFDLDLYARYFGGEYVLGKKDLHSDTCYMVYGTLKPGEVDRVVRPGAGYEEVLCAAVGQLVMSWDGGEMVLSEHHAVHLNENDDIRLANLSDTSAIYIIAGGKIACGIN